MGKIAVYCPRDMGNGILSMEQFIPTQEIIYMCNECGAIWLSEDSIEEVSLYFIDDFLKDRGFDKNRFDLFRKVSGRDVL
jgi:hypothetical protein